MIQDRLEGLPREDQNVFGDLSDHTASPGFVGDHTADSGDQSDHTAQVNISGSPTGFQESQQVGNTMPLTDCRQSLPYNPPSTTNDWVETHANRAKVLGLYADAFKKFDWIIYLIVGFVLIIVSILACHYFGTPAAVTSICGTLMTAAISLLKRNSS